MECKIHFSIRVSKNTSLWTQEAIRPFLHTIHYNEEWEEWDLLSKMAPTKYLIPWAGVDEFWYLSIWNKSLIINKLLKSFMILHDLVDDKMRRTHSQLHTHLCNLELCCLQRMPFSQIFAGLTCLQLTPIIECHLTWAILDSLP